MFNTIQRVNNWLVHVNSKKRMSNTPTTHEVYDMYKQLANWCTQNDHCPGIEEKQLYLDLQFIENHLKLKVAQQV